MEKPEIGPLTKALWQGEEGKAPAICDEWDKALRKSGDFILVWGGAAMATSKPGHSIFSWLSMSTQVNEEGEEDKLVAKTPPANVERMLAPLAHEARIKIMQALYPEPLAASDLAAATGFQGGALYHHLRELKYAAYLTDKGGNWALTPLGRQLLLTVTSMARQVVVDRGEEGLAVASSWKEGPEETPQA